MSNQLACKRFVLVRTREPSFSWFHLKLCQFFLFNLFPCVLFGQAIGKSPHEEQPDKQSHVDCGNWSSEDEGILEDGHLDIDWSDDEVIINFSISTYLGSVGLFKYDCYYCHK